MKAHVRKLVCTCTFKCLATHQITQDDGMPGLEKNSRLLQQWGIAGKHHKLDLSSQLLWYERCGVVLYCPACAGRNKVTWGENKH